MRTWRRLMLVPMVAVAAMFAGCEGLLESTGPGATAPAMQKGAGTGGDDFGSEPIIEPQSDYGIGFPKTLPGGF